MRRATSFPDWRVSLKDLLLRAGAIGLSQSKITLAMERLASKEEVADQLQTWQEERKVDKFTLRPKIGRPKTVWRATTLLEEEE